MNRTSRATRRRGVSVQLSTRDELVLRGLSRFRIARTGDLATLAFGGVRRETVNRRLRRLFDAGFLETHVGDRSEENVYSLGPAGKLWLADRGLAVGARPRGSDAHHLAIVRAWVELAAAVHAARSLQLTLVRPDWEIRERVPEAVLVPDALVELRLAAAPGPPVSIRFALEVDCGSERNAALRNKLERYASLLGAPGGLFGWHEFGLLVRLAAGGRRREVNVGALLESTWPGWSVLWTDEPAFHVVQSVVQVACVPALTASSNG